MGNVADRVYGAKARMALMVPSTNTVAETEFWKMAPEGLTVHTSRMPFFANRFDSPFDEMESHLPRVIDEVNSADPDVIAYGCTASSAKGNPTDYEKKLTRKTGKPTVTAAAALVEALRVFSAKRIVMITPYPQSTNDKERVFFQENGIEVIQDESIIVDDGQFKFKNMNKYNQSKPRKCQNTALLLSQIGNESFLILFILFTNKITTNTRANAICKR